MKKVTVVGAGLAGCEAAWQLAKRGVQVVLKEQKPLKRTPAQVSDRFAELVCSSSFRGASLNNAVGLLKEELRRSGSLILLAADASRVPAGGALAVDREKFANFVEGKIRSHPLIEVKNEEVCAIAPEADGPFVIATGPLTGEALSRDLEHFTGGHLAYYDAIAPIVATESIDTKIVFAASRWNKGTEDPEVEGGDQAYLNCPMNKAEYELFVDALLGAEKVKPRDFEDVRYFEGCLPIEVMAERGRETLRHGPMKPVGLTDPRTGRWPYAVVQLRQEDIDATAYNMVGFQTRMTYGEQKRVLSLIPGLGEADFIRFGSVHRNTFVHAPIVLDESLALRAASHVYLAGQITGVEGYVESTACGFACGLMLAEKLRNGSVSPIPESTAIGALLSHLRKAPTSKYGFQPSNVIWAQFPPLSIGEANLDKKVKKLSKSDRAELFAKRALEALQVWHQKVEIHTDSPL